MPPIIPIMRSGDTNIRKDNRKQSVGLAAILSALTILLSCRSVCAPVPNEPGKIAPPYIHAAAAIVINRDTGVTLWAKNPDARLPPASTTKIATGFLLARDVAPETIIRASANAAQTPGHALGMMPGETFRAQDVLHAILLASANDASVAAAEKMAGREDAFAARMNDWAQANGASHTHFANSSGLPAPGHSSTARDLALIARAALQNPVFAETVRTKTYSLPRSGGRPPTLLTNENTLLWTIPGMEGVKAGWTREAGFCFVGAASRNGLRLITVVLNSPDWQRETSALLNYGFAASGKRKKEKGASVGTQFIAPSTNIAPSSNIASSGGTAPTTNSAPSTKIAPPSAAPIDPKSDSSVPQNGTAASAPVTDSGGDSTRAKLPYLPALPALFNAEHASNNPTPNNTTTPQNSVSGVNRPQPGSILNRQSPIPSSFMLHPSSFMLHPSSFVTWLFLALLLTALLAGRLGKVAMPDFMFALFGKRRKPHSASGLEAGNAHFVPVRGSGTLSAAPEFRFLAPLLERRSAETWLASVLDSPTRLLEPATRRQARGILDADPHACETQMLALLQTPNMRLRVIGAELIARHAPRLAEDTLLGALKEEAANAEVRGDAVQLLADVGGDRHERLWLQMLLRDGFAPAASMLARLPRLEEASVQTLKHILMETGEGRALDTDLKRNLRNAHIACVLLAQGHFTRLDAAPYLNAVPPTHGEPILVATLRGTSRPEAIESLVEIVLHGHAYPALQALMEADPRLVRSILAAQEQNLDKTKQSRAVITKWLLWGEGNEKAIQGMATAGNDLARGALKLARMNRHDPALAPSDAILAAIQIYSLRLGFSDHATGDIALAFRKAAADGEAQSLSLLPSQLQPLAQAYAHPDVYEAVQFAMHGEDGLAALLATLARHPENPQYRRELAFWGDKVEAEHRLLLLNALCSAKETAGEETMRAAIESRAADPAPLVRNLALRWLHAHPNVAPVVEECLEP